MRVLFSVSLVPLNSSVEKYGKANNGGYFENAHVFLREKVPFFVQSRSMKLTPNEYEIFKLFFMVNYCGLFKCLWVSKTRVA